MNFTIQTLDHLKPLIQGFRKRANLTQAAMAEKLGISQQSYAQIESNLASTSVERLFTILRLMDVKLQMTDGNPDTAPAFQVKSKSRSPRGFRAVLGKRSRSVEDTNDTDKGNIPPAGPYLPVAQQRPHPQSASVFSQPGKPAMGAKPAKKIKPNDTTKW